MVVVSDDYGIPFEKRLYPKRRLVWENAHGEIPKDHLIIHLDGNQANCDISNLYCISQRTRMILNSNKWMSTNPEQTLAAIRWCELNDAIKKMAGKEK